MGGGHYDYDVARHARSTRREVFTHRGQVEGQKELKVHPLLDPFGKDRECVNPMPIVVAMDVTRSRGEDSKIIYAKLPTFISQIELKNYVSGAAISFAAVGDCDADKAPIQAGQFEADNRLDEALSKIWLEEGGGGTGQESYELAAYYYARHTKLASHQEGRKGFFFFLGDEGFYPTVNKFHVKRYLGRDLGADVPSAMAFQELQERFHTFLIYPKKTMAERKKDIDAEIRQRVLAAGGRYEGVDIRASLIWNNRNDLDLHVITPAGQHIFYGAKQASCGGWLDVDMNVRGETTKPVENVQWKYGTAPAGEYKIFVQNYRFHEEVGPTEFRVEIEINGKVQYVEGVIGAKGETGPRSDYSILSFHYDPSQRPPNKANEAMYQGYSDDIILTQWASVLPPAHILKIEDPQSIIDVMLGVLAMVGGGRSLDEYLSDLSSRGDQDARRDQAESALRALGESVQLAKTQVGGDLPDAGGPRRGSSTKRL